MAITHSTRDEIVEIINKLFIFTDSRQWQKLQDDVFASEVVFDMTSRGGENKQLTSKAICDLWQEGFEDIDATNHLGGNFTVTINDGTATVFAYATATHYRESAINGTTRELRGLTILACNGLTPAGE